MPSPPIALTMGDPAGIGLDITISAFVQRASHAISPFILYADPAAVVARAETLGVALSVAPLNSLSQAAAAFKTHLPVQPITLKSDPRAGEPDAGNGAAVIASIEAATSAVIAGDAAAVVTNPINKAVLYAAGFKHPGHTEFLAALAQRHQPGEKIHPVMMLAADELRVVPLTVHIPLAQVPGAITAGLIEETTRITAAALAEDFGIVAPRIAVAGLNPHAGEDGTMGLEERRIIAPAIAVLQGEGFNITGPHPADTLFHASARAKYDAVIAMYHDQALIPLKTLAFERGVNVTLGLPFIRTSPDHGTAYDIAGSGIADPRSLIAALVLADELAARRRAIATRNASDAAT